MMTFPRKLWGNNTINMVSLWNDLWYWELVVISINYDHITRICNFFWIVLHLSTPSAPPCKNSKKILAPCSQYKFESLFENKEHCSALSLPHLLDTCLGSYPMRHLGSWSVLWEILFTQRLSAGTYKYEVKLNSKCSPGLTLKWINKIKYIKIEYRYFLVRFD